MPIYKALLFPAILCGLLLIHPFGMIAGNAYGLRAAVSYCAMASIWWFILLELARLRRFAQGVFYLLLMLLALHLELRNFSLAPFTTALVWTSLALTALVAEILLQTWTARVSRKAAALFSIIWQMLIALPLLMIWLYNLIFHTKFARDTVVTLLQTTAFEVKEFLKFFLQPLHVGIFLAALFAVIIINLYQHKQKARPMPFLILSGLLAFAAIQLNFHYRQAGLIVLSSSAISDYFAELAQFRQLRDQRLAQLPEIKSGKAAQGETYILVIGESANRRHMGVYGYPRPTTPWLSEQAPQWLIFDHAYSSHAHTVPTLSLALTGANQYNRRPYFGSAAITDVLRQAGVKTYWFSNQVGLGGWDNPVTAIAESSDVYLRTNYHIGTRTETDVYDRTLVDVFKQQMAGIDPAANNFIVFHLMGSHTVYCARYPQTFQRFTAADIFRLGSPAARPDLSAILNCYDNSLLYTDRILSEIFAAAKQIKGFSALLYFSDHADDVIAQRYHNAQNFSYPMTHIPLAIWLSEEFKRNRPVRARALREHRRQIFSNDLIYDLLLGLMDIQTPLYEKKYDVSSPDYHPAEPGKMVTLHGERPIASDPVLIQQRNLAELASPRYLSHRTDTLGALLDAAQAGFQGVEADVTIRDGTPTRAPYFEIGHDQSAMTGGQLDDYLAVFTTRPLQRLWLDIKNLNNGNYPAALQALEKLDRQYAIKTFTVIESSTQSQWFAEFRKQGWYTSYYLPTETLLKREHADDEAKMLAGQLGKQLKQQNVAAISFDARLYAWVKKYLEAHLPPEVTFHTWDLSLHAGDADLPQRLERADYERDSRVASIILPFVTPYIR